MLKKEDKSFIISILAVVVSFLLLFTSVLSFTNLNLFNFKGAANKVGTVVTGKYMTGYVDNEIADFRNAKTNAAEYGNKFVGTDVTFPDYQYGDVRIVASNPSINPYGSILQITFDPTSKFPNGYKFDETEDERTKTFNAIVLDTGYDSSIKNGNTLDLKLKSKGEVFEKQGRVGITYKVLRVGYYNGPTTTAKKTTTTKAQELTLDCPSIMQKSSGYYCNTNQADVNIQVKGCSNSVSNTFKTTSSDMRKYMNCSNTGTVTVTASKGGVTLTRKIILTNTFGLGIKAQQINVDLDNSDTNVSTYNLKKSDFGNDSNRVLKIKYTFVKASGYYYRWFTYKTNDVNGELNYKDICRKITTTSFNYNPTLTIYKESKGRSGIIKVYKDKKDCENDKNVVTSKKIEYNITDYENKSNKPNVTTTSTKKLEVDATVTPHSGSVKESNGVYKILKSNLKDGNATTEFKVTPKDDKSEYYVRWFTYKNASISEKELAYRGSCIKKTEEYVTNPTLNLSTYSNRLGMLKVYSKESSCVGDTHGLKADNVVKELRITYKKVNSLPKTTTANASSLTLDCPSVGATGTLYKCSTNQGDVTMKVSGCSNMLNNVKDTFITTSNDFTKLIKCSNTGTVTVTATKNGETLKRDILFSNKIKMGVKMQEINKTVETSDTNVYRYILSKSDFGADEKKEFTVKFTFVNAKNYYIRWFTYLTSDLNSNIKYKTISPNFCVPISSNDALSANPTLTVFKESKGRSGIMKVYNDQDVCINDNDAKAKTNVVLSQSVVYQIGATEPSNPSGGVQTSNPNLVEKDGWYLIKNYYNHDASELGQVLGVQAKAECLQACYAYAIYLNSDGKKISTITPGTGFGDDCLPYKDKSIINNYKKIKEEIDKGFPLLMHVKSPTNQHWLLIVGYNKSKKDNPENWTASDIYGVDPYYVNNSYYKMKGYELKHGPISSLSFISYHSDNDLMCTENVLNNYDGR